MNGRSFLATTANAYRSFGGAISTTTAETTATSRRTSAGTRTARKAGGGARGTPTTGRLGFCGIGGIDNDFAFTLMDKDCTILTEPRSITVKVPI